MSEQQNAKLTLAQAFDILNQVASHKDLRLNLAEHAAVQQALQIIKPLTEPPQSQQQQELTLSPK